MTKFSVAKVTLSLPSIIFCSNVDYIYSNGKSQLNDKGMDRKCISEGIWYELIWKIVLSKWELL